MVIEYVVENIALVTIKGDEQQMFGVDGLVTRLMEWCLERKIYGLTSRSGVGLYQATYSIGDAVRVGRWLDENGAK